VLTDVTTDMVITHEETFRSVAPLYRLKMADDTEFGLAAYFYSRDIGRIWRVAEALEYGIVGINEGIISPRSTAEIAPFGGMKKSGIGPVWSFTGARNTHRGIPRSQIPLHGRHRPLNKHASAGKWPGGLMGLAAAAVRAAKPAARLGLGLHAALMLGDPRLGVRFGFKHADRGRMTVRDADLDTK
jgi:hypothetical protein